MKITILLNCQHLGIANTLRALRPDCEVQSFHLASFNTSEEKQGLYAEVANSDVIILAPLDSSWGALSTDSLRKAGRRFQLLLGIGFSGYHPDTVYVRWPGGELQAATGPLHSRIAIAGFLAGLSVEETMALFNKLVFSRLGYFDAFQQSRSFLVDQFRKILGVDLRTHINAWASQGCFMHSLNHPKIHVLRDLAVIACQLAGIEIPEDRAHLEMIPDNLGVCVEMPVYPEIANHLGITGHRVFKVGTPGFIYRFLPLKAYLRLCFNVYESAPRDHMLNANGVLDAMQKLGLPSTNMECNAVA